MTSRQSVSCPACGTHFIVDADTDAALAADVVLALCGICGRASQVPKSEGTGAVDDEETANVDHRLDTKRPRIIVGHEVPAASRAIADALRRGGFSPVCVRSGELVLAATDPTIPEPPAAIVLDVAIPGVLAFDVLETLRKHSSTADMSVVLLASVYEKTRYKRRPNRLYGADAYLELHHVPDRLSQLLWSLLRHEGGEDERQQAPVERARAAALRMDSPDAVDDATAETLARRLLSDVALYHGDEIAAGIKAGQPFATIDDAVSAARELHQKAGGDPRVFTRELTRFSDRLLQGKAVKSGATVG